MVTLIELMVLPLYSGFLILLKIKNIIKYSRNDRMIPRINIMQINQSKYAV